MTVHSPRRRVAASLLALGAGALAGACDNTLEPVGPTPPVADGHFGVSRTRSIQDFVDAQGTFCTADGGSQGTCFSLYGPAGPPDVILWCDLDVPTPCAYFDMGAYDRWLRARGVDIGTRYTGEVREKGLEDGRRLVDIHLKVEGSFTDVVDLELGGQYFDDPVGIANAELIGSTPLEVLAGVRAPLLGRFDLKLEMALPGGYDGLPDLVELLFAPPEGMELRSFTMAGSATGTMRLAYDGKAAGEPARVAMHLPWYPLKDGRLPVQAVAKAWRETFGSPGMSIEFH